jgi:hypothetical protein
MLDQPLNFHSSFNSLLDAFRNVIASLTWLKVSAEEAKKFFKSYPYTIELPCSVPGQAIKVDKSIFELVKREGFNQETPLYTQTLISFYRVFTIAVKDIIWKEKDFKELLQKDELQFLRHLRNASAHNNNFYWGEGAERKETISKLPVSWRGKKIEITLENTPAYMDFMKPGDIFLLLSDISSLAKTVPTHVP